MFFFLTHTAAPEIYTLSLHDALPICRTQREFWHTAAGNPVLDDRRDKLAVLIGENHLVTNQVRSRDRKSTRLNSSHGYISYAVFCLKKKNQNNTTISPNAVQQ